MPSVLRLLVYQSLSIGCTIKNKRLQNKLHTRDYTLVCHDSLRQTTSSGFKGQVNNKKKLSVVTLREAVFKTRPAIHTFFFFLEIMQSCWNDKFRLESITKMFCSNNEKRKVSSCTNHQCVLFNTEHKLASPPGCKRNVVAVKERKITVAAERFSPAYMART